MPPRNVTVSNKTPSVAVSDLARSDPDYRPAASTTQPTTQAPPAPGQPFHKNGWGASGTVDAPPRSAAAYGISITPPESRDGELAPNTPSAQVDASPADQASTEQDTSSVPQASPDYDRVGALENQVANLGTLLATVSSQLQSLNSVPPVLPGTANPNAPTPHMGSPVQRTIPKIEGPVIPKPSNIARFDEGAPRLPNQAPMPQLLPGEEELTQAEYIEKHFRLRDLSIEQIAWMCHTDTADIIDILKELGYQFSDGAN